ncbi:MAG: hypothetical protein HVK25_03785 [Pelagibacteraceae bacterium]|jgi:hypothetical protein|nr:hypothetical protein [Pelagibacteraceae bacterium]|tara:strand:- start:33 stop:491 length:459 start_codon:yes stop_codon:yes gene_type:complete
MKKIWGILIVVVFWCNVATSEILELGNDLRFKIPDNYEYIQINYKKYLDSLTKSVDKKYQKELKKLNKKDAKHLGLDGKEIITIIGNEGFGELYSSLVNHHIEKKKGQWEGFKIIEKECGEAGMIEFKYYAQGETELTYELKKFTKCMQVIV